jgi:hypothetical protein
MANWAQNWVEFSGEETNLQNLKSCFKAMELKEKQTNEGQIPEFMAKPKQDWFFNIYVDETDTISYDTKWSPNIDDLIEIANHFDLNFIATYQETSNNIFGKAIFTAGNSEAKIYDLDNTDFDLFSTNEDFEIYIFEGFEYESQDEILENIFERKFNQSY